MGKCFFCKKKWEMGGGCKKVENGVRGVFVKKSGKWGAFFVKKVDLSSTQGTL